jgi:hypothetical protein
MAVREIFEGKETQDKELDLMLLKKYERKISGEWRVYVADKISMMTFDGGQGKEVPRISMVCLS